MLVKGGVKMKLRDRVLEVLEENKGKSVSGSEIAKTVNMTRSAVWKVVKALREDGYSICAVTNKGYCLADDNDILSESAIKNYLKTERLGRKMDVFKTIDSTNSFAKSLAQLGAEHGTTVISELQTQGRGRMGRSFYSPSGMGVYMSFVLRPNLSVDYALMITSCVAVAVCEAIENVADVQCEIKWVNDIFCNGKKICGILTEASIDVEQGGLEYAVVGLGLNVSNTFFPKDIEKIASSLKAITGKNINRSLLIAEILNSVEKKLAGIKDKSFIEEYRRRSMLIGKRIVVIKSGVETECQCTGIDEFGKLLVKYDNGNDDSLCSGTVRIVE